MRAMTIDEVSMILINTWIDSNNSWSDHKGKLGEIGRKLFVFFVDQRIQVLIIKYQGYNYLLWR